LQDGRHRVLHRSGYWCLTELIAERACRRDPDMPMIRCENLVREGVPEFRRTLIHAGCHIRIPEGASAESVTEPSSTSHERKTAAAADRLSSWQSEF
jgi:hypothetical protein